MARVQNGEEILPKVSIPAWTTQEGLVSERTNVTDDRRICDRPSKDPNVVT